MDTLSISAASGMKSRLEALDLLANNLANSSTTGFKADREFYGLFVSPDAIEGGLPVSTPPVVERNWTDFSQGTLNSTGNPLDFGLSGSGFFTVQSPAGLLYTRDGNFHLGKDGVLQTAQGYTVQGADGQPIKLDASRPVEVTADGTLRQGGQTVGQLAVVDISRNSELAKTFAGYFRFSDPAATPAKPANATVHQGRLEASNLATAETAVRLIGVMRQFEMLQRAASLGAEMNRRSVEEVAKAGA